MLVLQYSLYIFQTYKAIALALFGSFDEVRTASCGKKNNKNLQTQNFSYLQKTTHTKLK